MSDETTTSERVGFCQDCGKPVNKDDARIVGNGTFCEPCLHARLNNAAGTTQTAASNAGYTQTVPPLPPMGMPPIEKLPSPVLAGLLSIIPGVGQVYNGQYVKGIVILLVCAVLKSLGETNHLGFFGLVAFGWWIFQIVDAYQTAKARVEGRPLPNPLDLNDIGDRLGFGKGFGTSAAARAAAYGAAPVTPPAPAASQTTAQTTPSWAGYVPPAPPPAASYSAATGNAPYVAPVPPMPYSTPYSTPQVPPPMPSLPLVPMPEPGSSFPLVAVWLIGLGMLFALGEWVPSWHVNGSSLLAILLGAIAATIFVRRLGYMGGMSYPGTMLHMMRGPMLLAVLAVLFLLQGVHAATIAQTWPVILLGLGAVLLGERMGLGSQAYAPPQSSGPVSVVPPAQAATSDIPASGAVTATETAEQFHQPNSDERDGYGR